MKNTLKIRRSREFVFDDRELYIMGGGAIIICVLLFILGFLIGGSYREETVASPLVGKEYLADIESEATENAPPVSPETQPQDSATETTASNKKSQLSNFRVLPENETYVEVEVTPAKRTTPGGEPSSESQPSTSETKTPPQAVKKEVPPQTATTPKIVPTQAVAAIPALPNVPKSPTDEIRVSRHQPFNTIRETDLIGEKIYSVQVSSSQKKQDSERLAQKFWEAGYEAYVMTADLGNKGIWYRVRVGNLATREAAEQHKRDILNKVPQLARNPFVITIE